MTQTKQPPENPGRFNQPITQRLLKRTPHVSQQELLANPHFAQARIVFLESFLAVYGEDRFLVRLLIETGRSAVFLSTLILDAAHDPDRRETWFTVGRLKRQIASLRLGACERQVDYLDRTPVRRRLPGNGAIGRGPMGPYPQAQRHHAGASS